MYMLPTGFGGDMGKMGATPAGSMPPTPLPQPSYGNPPPGKMGRPATPNPSPLLTQGPAPGAYRNTAGALGLSQPTYGAAGKFGGSPYSAQPISMWPATPQFSTMAPQTLPFGKFGA